MTATSSMIVFEENKGSCAHLYAFTSFLTALITPGFQVKLQVAGTSLKAAGTSHAFPMVTHVYIYTLIL
jgi:hypothetical protein